MDDMKSAFLQFKCSLTVEDLAKRTLETLGFLHGDLKSFKAGIKL